MRNNFPRTGKKVRTITEIVGIFLLAAALILYFSERLLIVMEARECERISSYREKLIPERSSGIVEARYYVEMPSAIYQGNDYIALLEVPGSAVSLAVAAKYEEQNNTKCPGRLSGSAYDGTLTIIGYDGSGQLAFLNHLDFGDTVTVTDMLGQ
ncbi:MAG: hypothetical protein MJ175_09800, partial [Clostridia bacterium]|nr:hypothetical protein [Clostridia bacterium]